MLKFMQTNVFSSTKDKHNRAYNEFKSRRRTSYGFVCHMMSVKTLDEKSPIQNNKQQLRPDETEEWKQGHLE